MTKDDNLLQLIDRRYLCLKQSDEDGAQQDRHLGAKLPGVTVQCLRMQGTRNGCESNKASPETNEPPNCTITEDIPILDFLIYIVAAGKIGKVLEN